MEEGRERSHQETSGGQRAQREGQEEEAETSKSGETPPPESLPSWERAERYEAVLAAAAAAAAAAHPTNATAHRAALVAARRTLREYYTAAFECLTAMAHTATGEQQAQFRMALQDLALRRHRYQSNTLPSNIKVKRLVFSQPGEQEAAEEPLCLGYEDVIIRRIDDLLSGYSEPERAVIVAGLRRVLRAHDAALRSIWQHYTKLDLQQLLLDDSALPRDDGYTPSPSPSPPPPPRADEVELVRPLIPDIISFHLPLALSLA